MDNNRPGLRGRGKSYLTEKFLAGRGRILKEYSKRSPRAEEVQRRKHLQHLILSGQILLDKGIENYYKSAGGGSSSSSVSSSSSSQVQLADSSDQETTSCSKAPLGTIHSQEKEEWNTNTLNNNYLEEHVQNLHIVDDDDVNDDNDDNDDHIPPRFRNSPWGKTFRMHSKKNVHPNQNMHTNHIQLKEVVSEKRPEKTDQVKLQQPLAHELNQTHGEGSNPWHDWEASVAIQGSVDDDDIEEIAVVEDNDDLNDVIACQYVSALHDQEEKDAAAIFKSKSAKITPLRVQELSKLKSTTNADSYKVPPGTLPKPPKGLDRWGGVELKGNETPTGWGDAPNEENGNWYDDGSLAWGNTSMPYGASGAWSWNS